MSTPPNFRVVLLDAGFVVVWLHWYIDSEGKIDSEQANTRPLQLGDQLYETREEAEVALAKYVLREGS